MWREGTLVFYLGLGRHRVALEGHEEDIVKLVLFKQAFNRQVWCTIEFSIRFLCFSSFFLVTSHISIGCSTKSDPKPKGRPFKPPSLKDPR